MWAHSANAAGHRHALVDHLYGTASLAQQFAEPFGGGDAAFFAGLAHDAGKASCSWQQGLVRAEAAGGRVGVDHKTLGVPWPVPAGRACCSWCCTDTTGA